MARNPLLVRKGSEVPLAGLLDQSGVSRKLRDRHLKTLLSAGWTEAASKKWDDAAALLGTERMQQLEARNASRKDTLREGAAIDSAKEFKTKLDLATDDIYADARENGTELPVLQNAFFAGRTLGRSSALIVKYLGDVKPAVVTLGARLAPYFQPDEPVKKLDQVRDDLSGAQSTQETGRGALPEDTQELYEAKGIVLSAIEKLNRISKIGFHGQAELVGQFNKDLILRARRPRKPKTE